MSDDDTPLREALATELMREFARQRTKAGYFLVRLVIKGPLVAAWVQETPDGWRAIIDGEPTTCHPDPAMVPGVALVAMRGKPCTAGDYLYRLETAAWARANTPDAPEAKPMESIDLHTMPPVF